VEVTDDDVFDRYPSAMLELFVVIEQHPEIRRRARSHHQTAHASPVAHQMKNSASTRAITACSSRS
jgi:UTP:GlnB (protein PII) uridylyltransferase